MWWCDFGLNSFVEESDGRDVAELGAAIQTGNLKDEKISDQLASQLLDEGAGSSSGTT